MKETPALMTAIGEAMRYLGERQRVVAQNIANADTPGFKARELKAPSFAAMVDSAGGQGPAGQARVARPRVEISDAMRGLGASPSVPSSAIDTGISEVKPDGNTVTLEDQLLKMGQIQADYAALASLYAKQRSLLRVALGKGGNSV